MFSGEFIDQFNCMDKLRDVIHTVQEGYIKSAWRDEGKLYMGYLLFKKDVFIGAKLEDVINGIETVGNDAYFEILKAFYLQKASMIEVYSTDVGRLLKLNPKITINVPVYLVQIDSVIATLRHASGKVIVRTENKNWTLLMEEGRILAIKGNSSKGDAALKELLMNINHIIKKGEITLKKEHDVYSSDDGRVTRGDLLLESLYLVRDKLEFESINKQKSQKISKGVSNSAMFSNHKKLQEKLSP